MGRCPRWVLLHAEDYDQLLAAGGGQITLLEGVDFCRFPILQSMAHTHTHTDNIYWTWYHSFLSITTANILTKCILEMKIFIFAYGIRLHAISYGSQCRNLKPGLFAILHSITSSKEMYFAVNEIQQGQWRMWLIIWLAVELILIQDFLYILWPPA